MAYDIARLEQALINADKAGDTEAATAFANEIRRMRGQQFSTEKMVRNIPSSAVQLGKNYYQAVRHPIQTSAGAGNLFLGPLLNMLPESLRPRGSEQITKTIPVVNEAIKNRYGSFDKFKQTLQNDPVGVLNDVAAILAGGGGIASKLPGVAGKVGATAQRIGVSAEPLNIVGKVAKAPLRLLPKKLPQRMYQSAAKFSTTLPIEERTKMVKTALREKITPDIKGLAKLEGKIKTFDDQIDNLVSAADKQGKTIPKSQVFTHLKELRRDIGGAKLEGSADLSKINRVAKLFDEHMKKMGKENFTPSELQKFKRDAYDKVKWKPGRTPTTPAKEKIYKTIARGAKEGVEQAVPGVGDLNRQLGELLSIQEPLQRSASRIENLNIVPLTAPLNIGTGSYVGGPAGGIGAALASLLEMPKVKSRAAIALDALQRQKLVEMLMNNNIPRTMIRQGAIQAARIPQNQ